MRGDLLLTNEEVQSINEMIEPHFRFHIPECMPSSDQPTAALKNRMVLKRTEEKRQTRQSNPSNTLLSNLVSPVNFPVRHSRRRREVLTGHWKDYCNQVMEQILRHAGVGLFLEPVDETLYPDYIIKIDTPMDLGTVQRKLDTGAYLHPFQWQEDVRRVFENSFKYNEDAEIRASTMVITSYFEKLCREVDGVNPYGVFEDEGKMTAQLMQQVKMTADAITARNMKEAPLPPKIPSHPVPDPIVNLEPIPLIEPMHLLLQSQMPPAPPPPLYAIPGRQTDRPMNEIQRRTTVARFRDLDVAYRKSVLTIVKDELGVDVEKAAVDVSYLPDVDLLPSQKQKELLTYIKIIDAAQKRAIDTNGIFPVLATNTGATHVVASPSIADTSTYLPKPQPLPVPEPQPESSATSSSSDTDTEDEDLLESFRQRRTVNHVEEEKLRYDPVHLEGGSEPQRVVRRTDLRVDSTEGWLNDRKTVWPEWKGKVLQQYVTKQHLSDEGSTEREREAEGADAEI